LGRNFVFSPFGIEKISVKKEDDVSISLTEKSTSHYFTGIIGENGSGKSTLLKSIIYTLNSLFDDGSLPDIVQQFIYAEKNSTTKQAWQKYKAEPSAITKQRLFDLGIIKENAKSRKQSSDEDELDPDVAAAMVTVDKFLQNDKRIINDIDPHLLDYIRNTQIIHIANGKYDSPIHHINPLFRSFATDKKLSSSEFLITKAYFIDYRSTQINNWLRTFLKVDDVQVNFIVSFMPSRNAGRFLEELGALMSFSATNATPIGALQQFSLPDRIQSSSFFAEIFMVSKSSFQDVIHRIQTSSVLTKLYSLLSNDRRIIPEGLTPKEAFRIGFDSQILNSYEDLCLLFLFEELGYLRIDVKLNGCFINALSGGEKEMIRMATYLSHASTKGDYSQKNLLLLIDEPENSLHPEWQYHYFSHVNQLLNDLNYQSAQVIFTTHSPMVLMGLEKAKLNYKAFRAKKVFEDDESQKKNSFEAIEKIKDFYAEEMLLDVFKLRYRDNRKYDAVTEYLKGTNKIAPEMELNDPLRTVVENKSDKMELREIARRILEKP